jgi:hypothetical protein
MPSTASIFLTTSFPGASMRSFDAGDHVVGPGHDIGGAHHMDRAHGCPTREAVSTPAWISTNAWTVAIPLGDVYPVIIDLGPAGWS